MRGFSYVLSQLNVLQTSWGLWPKSKPASELIAACVCSSFESSSTVGLFSHLESASNDKKVLNTTLVQNTPGGLLVTAQPTGASKDVDKPQGSRPLTEYL